MNYLFHCVCIFCFCSSFVLYRHVCLCLLMFLFLVITPFHLFDLFPLHSPNLSMCSLCTFPPAPIIHRMRLLFASLVLILDNPLTVSANNLNFNHPLSLLNQAAMADIPVKGHFFVFYVFMSGWQLLSHDCVMDHFVLVNTYFHQSWGYNVLF